MTELSKEQIKDLLSQVIDEKSADSKRKEAAEAVIGEAKETIESLTKSLEAKDEEINTLKNSLTVAESGDTFKEEMENLRNKIAELEKALQESKDKANVAEAALSEIKKAEILKGRLDKLTEAKVFRAGEAGEVQKTKVKDMSDEDFSAYISELAALREEVLKSQAADINVELTEEEVDKFASTLGCDKGDEKCLKLIKEVAFKIKEVVKPKEGNVPPPPEIKPEQKAMAGLNLELVHGDEIKKKFNDLGQAMAEMMIRKK